MKTTEQILEILDKYWIRSGWLEENESMVERRPLNAKDQLLSEIKSLIKENYVEKDFVEWCLKFVKITPDGYKYYNEIKQWHLYSPLEHIYTYWKENNKQEIK